MTKRKGALAVLAVLAIMVCLVLSGCTTKYTQAELDAELDAAAVTEKANLDAALAAQKAAFEVEKESLFTQEEVDSAKASATAGLYTQAELDEKLVAKETEVATEVAETEAELEANGYVLDDLKIGLIDWKCLSDKHVSKLLDSEVEFDGDDYKVEEFVCLGTEGGPQLSLSVNEDDFGADVYLTAEKLAVEYRVEFDNELLVDFNNQDEDETFKFNLLGEEVEVSKWEWIITKEETNESEEEGFWKITLIQGEEFELDEGAEMTIGESVIQLVYVDEQGAKFVVNGELTNKLSVSENEVYTFEDGSELQLVDVLYQDYLSGIHRAEFKFGNEEVEVVIEDGEPYEDDSMWEWFVGENVLSLKLVEELTERDEDEEFEALAYGESISLPEDYVSIEFVGMDEEKVLVYDFDVDDGFLEVEGDFDTNDYDKLFVDATGIYLDEDKEDEDTEQLSGCVQLGDTEFCLLLDGETVQLTNGETDGNEVVVLSINLSEISIAGQLENALDEEEDFRTVYGLVLSSPEDAIEDQELTVTIPEERLTGKLVIQ